MGIRYIPVRRPDIVLFGRQSKTDRSVYQPRTLIQNNWQKQRTVLAKDHVLRWVQNYPYNARWTWKPVARSRTLRPAQPRPIIIRHAAPGRHPSQRPVVMYQSIGRNEAYLRLLANQLLSKDESEDFKNALHNFRLSKSIPKLCSDLRPIITTVDKMILLVEISNRLPSHLRQDFHRLCSLQFDNYNEVLRSMSPGKRFQEKAKVIAQDSSGAIRVLAKGNQKTLVFTSQADHEAMRRNAVSASENSFNMDQTSSLFKDNESYRMFRKSESSENSEDTLFASLNETNNAIYSDPRTYGDNKTGVYSTPMQLGSSLDSSTASESFETFRHKYNKTQHPQMNGRGIVGPPIPSSGLAFRPAVRHVTLTRSGRNSLGISIKGGKEHNTTISVQTVEQGSQAEKKGLSPGDVILEVNGYSFQNISHTRAVEIIKSLHNLHLTVTKPRLQPTTVKMERNLGEAIPVHRLAEVDLTVMATKEGGLGFSLSGGADQTSSPVVTDVFKNSPAEKAGLEPGDRVLKILGIDVKDLTHKQIVSLATSSRVLKLRIQRRVQEQARSALYNGTIRAGNHVGGLLSLPNGDGPQFASSPVIRRKSQSTMSIDGDDKENNNNNVITSGFVNQSSKPRNIFNVSNAHHGHNIHDVHNFKVHAEQTHVSRFEDNDFPGASNARRKYVKRREQTAPPAFREPTYSTYIHRQSVPSYEQGGYHGHVGSNRSLERRSHYSSTGDVSRSPHSTLQRSRSPFPSFIVVPTPNDLNTRAALKDGLDKRNKTLQTVGNVYPSSTDADWKI